MFFNEEYQAAVISTPLYEMFGPPLRAFSNVSAAETKGNITVKAVAVCNMLSRDKLSVIDVHGLQRPSRGPSN